MKHLVPPQLSAGHIREATCLHFGILPEDMASNRRHATIVRARETCCHILKRSTTFTWWQIADLIGLHAHSTALDAAARLEKRLAAKDAATIADIREVRQIATELDAEAVAQWRRNESAA